MGFLRALISAPYRLVGAVVGFVGRVVSAVIASALLAAGMTIWLHFGYATPGIAIAVLGLLLAGRAIA